MTNFIPHVIHADLSDGFQNETYWVQVAGTKIPLIAHTSETRAAAKASSAQLQKIEDKYLTHFTQEPVQLPSSQAVRISIRHTVENHPEIPNHYGIHHVAMYSPPKPQATELTTTAPAEAPGLQTILMDYTTTANCLIYHHADLINQDPTYSAIVLEHFDPVLAPANYNLIQQFAMSLRALGVPTSTTGWANWQPFDASDAIASGAIQAPPSQVASYYSLKLTDEATNNMNPALSAVLTSTKNDTRLQNIKWNQEAGNSVQTTPTTGSPVPSPIVPATSFVTLGTANATFATDDNWRVSMSNTHAVDGLQTSIQVVNSSTQQAKISMTNTYIRWLGVYLEFIDANGKSMSLPDWQIDDNDDILLLANFLGINYDNVRFAGYITPIDTILGVPDIFNPGTVDITFTFPAGAVSVNIYGCGIGISALPYPLTPILGGVYTGIANFGIPALFLGLLVSATSYKPVYKIMSDLGTLKDVVNVGKDCWSLLYDGLANNEIDWSALEDITKILFNKAAEKILEWCELQIVKGEIEDEIPFAGWIMAGIHAAADILQMTQTVVEVCSSDFMIKNSAAVTITSTIEMRPDPRLQTFPQGSPASYVTKMIFQNNRPTNSSTNAVPAGNTAVTFSNQYENPLGGQVKFEVDYYIGSWLAGQATTSWMPNDEEHTGDVVLYLVDNPIPLDKNSVYTQQKLLTYQNGSYQWTPNTTPPTATITNTDASQSGNAISQWLGLALSQRYATLGMSWKAAGTGVATCADGSYGQVNVSENFSIPGMPMKTSGLPSCGLTGATRLVFDVFPPKFLMENGQWVLDNNQNPQPDPNDKDLGSYYIDPRKATNNPYQDGGYHLRQVNINPISPFNMAENQLSWGRFPLFPDSMTMHPSGFVIGVNIATCKIMISHLPATGQNDADIPMAKIASGQAQNFNTGSSSTGGRAGLLFSPKGIACTYDGTTLILEQLASQTFNIARLQAFDLNGNPVNYFSDDQGNPSPFMALPNNSTYLDVVAIGDVKTTYVYVLYYTGTGQQAADYSVAIYQCGQDAPAGNFLVKTDSIPAARIQVDMWHTLYTLNYSMTTNGNGTNAGPNSTNAGPNGQTVPSMSQWLPPVL